jgi:hypothetical protein
MGTFRRRAVRTFLREKVMFTIFACPKPFTNPHIALIQRNAITSWTLLRPQPEIILFGDEQGTAEICHELRLRHIPQVVCNEFSTPLVSDIFETAQRLATYDLMCYVNADIVFVSDFIHTIKACNSWKKQCLVVGARLDVDVHEGLDFGVPDWEEKLKALANQKGRLMIWGADYFIFSRGLFQEIPLLAIGRTAWDNWLLWKAHHMRVPLVDATAVITAIHQNHGTRSDWKSENLFVEANRNQQMTGYWVNSFTPGDATHDLTDFGLRRRFWRPYRQRLKVLVNLLMSIVRSVRYRAGLRRSTFQYLKQCWRR